MAVGLITIRNRGEDAVRFWEKVARMEGLTATDPEYQAGNFLISQSFTSDRPWRVARNLAACWNAHVKNRKLQGLSVKEWAKPIRLLGCEHYDGREHYLPLGMPMFEGTQVERNEEVIPEPIRAEDEEDDDDLTPF
jgi:hypothetical protein